MAWRDLVNAVRDRVLDTFSESATLYGQLQTLEVQAIYTAPYEPISVGGINVESPDPIIEVLEYDAKQSGIRTGDKVLIRDTEHTVVSIQWDQIGTAFLTLRAYSDG